MQVLTNLLRNAAQAPDVSHIRVRAQSHSDELTVWVEDNGSGIPTSHHHQVFDPFFTTKKEGTGLGLTTCHSIILEHGGTIRPQNVNHGREKRGCRFVITLPLEGPKDDNKSS